MDVDKKEQMYWNNVGRVIRTDPKAKRFSDNFQKRRALFEALLKYDLSETKILELGTGLGYTAFTICGVNTPSSYVGVDVSDTMARYAKELFGLKVVVGDATKLPFADKTFDAFFAFDVLEHISPEKKPQLYNEIDRVMKGKDRIIFINNPLSQSAHDLDFEFGFDEMEVAKLCKATGTKIVEVKLLFAGSCAYQFIVLGHIARRGK